MSPSFDLAQEILTVLGEPIGFTGTADVGAIATARLALDPELAVPSTPASSCGASAGLASDFSMATVVPFAARKQTCCSARDVQHA